MRHCQSRCCRETTHSDSLGGRISRGFVSRIQAVLVSSLLPGQPISTTMSPVHASHMYIVTAMYTVSEKMETV